MDYLPSQALEQTRARRKPRDEQDAAPEQPLADGGAPLRHDREDLRAHVPVTGIAAGGIDGKNGLWHGAQDTARGSH
jgi:hypothetical protein